MTETKKGKIHLSIIVPFCNEGAVIEKTAKDIIEYHDKKDFTIEAIFCANPHTREESLSIARKYSEKYPYIKYTQIIDGRKGKGQAVQDGIFTAKGEYLIFMDADSSTEISEVDKLLPYVKEYQIVMGSRYIKGAKPYQENYFKALFHGIKSLIEVLIFGHSRDYMAKGKQGRIRQFISRGGNLAFAVLLNQSYIDQRCGFKLYQTRVAKILAGLQTIYGFGFDTEYLAIAQKYKFKTIEVPVEWYDRAEGASVNPIKDSINSFKDIFKVQKNLIRNKYSRKIAARKLEKIYGENLLKK